MPTSQSAVRLHPIALALLAKRYPARRAPVSDATLAALLAKAKVAGHAPAIAFERAYGSLAFPDYGEGRSWRKSNDPWIVGPAACLDADVSFSAPGKKKLVPVLYTTNDVAYYLAADGVAWGEDMVGDDALGMFAPNTRAMMTRIFFGEHVFFCPAAKKVEIEGARGQVAAKALRLRAIADATDATERWWSDGTSFVVERTPKRGRAYTTIAYPSKGALAKVGIEEPAPKRAPKGPVTFDTVMLEGAPVCAVTLVKAKLDAVYAAFFETLEPGTVTQIDDSNPLSRRVRLDSAGTTFKKKTSRVEIFFRDTTISTLVNVFQFDVKDRVSDAAQERWFELLAAVSEKVEREAGA